jgi:phage gp46-like protein
MPDIRIVQNTFFPKYSVTCDWNLLADGTLDETEALATAVIVALGTDSLASTDDILPDPDATDRAGWWGDLDAEEIWDGWPIGSKLWLLKRSKITGPEAWEGSTLVRVEQYIRDAIQPFISRRIGSNFAVEATRVFRSDGNGEEINALVRVYRGPLLEVDLRFQLLWQDIERVNDNYNIGRIANPLSSSFPTP